MGHQSEMEKERLPHRELEASSPIKLKESATDAESAEQQTTSELGSGLSAEVKSQHAETITESSEQAKHASYQLSAPTERTVAFPDIGEDLEVLSFIGEGGMGFVYRVLDKRLSKEFAVKLLRNELARDQTKLTRFKQEVDSATSLDHPNLVTVYHHAIAPGGTPYMVMDFVDGSSLAEILSRDVFLEPMRANALFLQICDGVAHAHLNGVVHLDLKPSNVLVAQNDKVEIAKVSDFGIAQVMTDDSQQISQTEEIVGSLPYMSPEHCRGEILDYRSDIYSLGCLMYEVLTGKPPFVGENPVKTIMKHIQDKPPRLKSRLTRLDIPEGLEKIVLHCLEKDPEHRYQNTEELIKDLELVRDGSDPYIAVQQESTLKSLGREESQKRLRVGLLAGLVGLVLYFTHLSQFDTLAQTGMALESAAIASVIFAFSFCFYQIFNYHKQVVYRLENLAQIRPGDHWLSLGLISAMSTFLYLAGFMIMLFINENHIVEMKTIVGFAPDLAHPIVSTILVALLVLLHVFFLIWYFKQKSNFPNQKYPGW